MAALSSSVVPEGKSRSIRLIFHYDSTIHPEDCDVEKVLSMLKTLQEFGIDVRIVDTTSLSDDKRTRPYFDAIVGAVIQKAAIRQVFGSRRNPAFLFGRQVPALLVYDKANTPPICVDVYPQRQSIIDGTKRSIESYLDNALKTQQPSARYHYYVDEGRRALQSNLGGAAVLYAVLAIDSFIWRVLWGQNDITWVGIDGRHHKWSSVDFVSRFARRSAKDFSNPEQFEKLKENNMRLFKKLRDTDSFLLEQAVHLGVVKDSEREMVQTLRIVRNVCAHFNPYEVTLSQYRKALQKLGMTVQVSFTDIERVAEAVIEKATSLLSLWEPRTRP